MPEADHRSFNSFTCPNCQALYQLVKVEAGSETNDRELTCLSCGGPLASREGKFVLKYFLGRPPALDGECNAPLMRHSGLPSALTSDFANSPTTDQSWVQGGGVRVLHSASKPPTKSSVRCRAPDGRVICRAAAGTTNICRTITI